jgi:hypothetical protein
MDQPSVGIILYFLSVFLRYLYFLAIKLRHPCGLLIKVFKEDMS